MRAEALFGLKPSSPAERRLRGLIEGPTVPVATVTDFTIGH